MKLEPQAKSNEDSQVGSSVVVDLQIQRVRAPELLHSFQQRLKMVIYDRWDADDGYSLQGEELNADVADWSPPNNKTLHTLRLEELTQYDVAERIETRERNLIRLNEAKRRADIAHLEVHYTCCVDKKPLFHLNSPCA